MYLNVHVVWNRGHCVSVYISIQANSSIPNMMLSSLSPCWSDAPCRGPTSLCPCPSLLCSRCCCTLSCGATAQIGLIIIIIITNYDTICRKQAVRRFLTWQSGPSSSRHDPWNSLEKRDKFLPHMELSVRIYDPSQILMPCTDIFFLGYQERRTKHFMWIVGSTIYDQWSKIQNLGPVMEDSGVKSCPYKTVIQLMSKISEVFGETDSRSGHQYKNQ